MGEFCNLKEKLNNIENKQYQISYDEENKCIKKTCISYGSDNLPNLVFILRLTFLEYMCMVTQYNLSDQEINEELLKIIGILFIKDNKTMYSLDIANINGTNELNIYLKNYNTNNISLIDKIENFPGNKEIINLLLNKLSDVKVSEIFRKED